MYKTPPPEKVKQIFEKTLEKIIPSSEELEHISSVIEEITIMIENSDLSEAVDIKFIEPQGSTGIKQTSIKHAADIDLFIGLDPGIVREKDFPSKTKKRKFIRKFFKKLIYNYLMPYFEKKDIKDLLVSYAEHPYISAKYKKLELDIVLCFDLSLDYLHENGPITAVDRSPQHSRFIKSKLSDFQRNQVRLLKYLFKCQHCYGDKTAVGRNGFMGYAAELYIAYFGDIWQVFQNFGSLDSTVISFKDYLRSNECDFEQKYGGKSFKKIQETYFPNDNLIILDPTDYNRNVASSISYRTFLFMKKTISSFIKLPSPSYFERNPIEPIGQKNLDKEELGKYFYMEYYVEEDDHYTKFRDKLYSFMSKVTEMAKRERTEEKRFEDPKGELVYDIPSKSYVLSLSTSTPSISPKFIREGPPVNSNYHSKKFLQAHPDAFKKNGFYCIKQERKFSRFDRFLKHMAEKEKFKKLILRKIGCATQGGFSLLAGQSMGILYEINEKNIP